MIRHHRSRWFAAAGALLLLGTTGLARADDHDRREGREGIGERRHEERREERHEDRHEEWRGDIRAFHEHDIERWRGGRWFRGPHDGRRGWWWIVAGTWYFYPEPVYPYPDPYQPPVVVLPPEPAAAPVYLYYCGNPSGYYPYVPRCLVPWQRVLSQPTAPPAGYPPPQ